MPFAYLCSPGSVVRLVGDSLTVTPPGDQAQPIQLHAELLTALLIVGRVSVSAQAQAHLLRRRVPLAFLSKRGECLGRLEPSPGPAVAIRLAQRRLLEDPGARLPLARRVVASKVAAMLEVIRDHRGNHPDQRLAVVQADLSSRLAAVDAAPSVASLLGIEGVCARLYFNAFAMMNRSDLPFPGRRRRPPPDPINAMLSLAYTLLGGETHALAAAVGLDPYIGALHDPSPRRPALAMDLMEPFRHAVIDRLVLAAVNVRRFAASDFEQRTHSARFRHDALKRFLALYEDAMSGPTPPVVSGGEPRPVRLAILARAERLVTWLREHDPGLTVGKCAPHRDAA